jgi:MSHA biogenesis protein MshN
MSLINQMLLDLERRGALQGPATGQADIRPVRVNSAAKGVAWLAGLAATTAVVAAVIWGGGHGPGVSPATPLATVGPVERVPEVRSPSPQPVQREADTTGRTGNALNDSARLKVSTQIESRAGKEAARPRPTPDATVKSKPAAAVATANAAVPIQRIVRSERDPAGTAEQVAGVSPAPNADVRPTQREPGRAGSAPAIDKTVRQLSPQQQAENGFRKAVALMQQGRVAEAIEGLNATLQLDPGHVAARQTLAALLVETKRIPEAQAVLEEGVRAAPEDPRLAMALARIQVERGAWEPALATLERAQARAANDPDYQGFMGSVLQRLSRHREAIDHYLAAIRLSPESGLWLVGAGISLQADDRRADAREAFQRAKATNTLSPELVAFVDQRLHQLAPAK